MAEITWTQIRGISLASAARKVGFDLAIFDSCSLATQRELKMKTIADAIETLNLEYYRATGRDLSTVDRGVYVICVGWPFAVKYSKTQSDVIYIGMGRVAYRLKSHFERSLFDLMESLQGVDFTFFISEPRMPRVEDYYKHVEFLMLAAFRKTIGGGTEYPLLNKNAGSKRNVRAIRNGWKLPLKRSGKRPRWYIEPTRHNEFRKLD